MTSGVAIDIVFVDGRVEHHQCNGDRITLGRSPAATLSLPSILELAPKHLLLIPRERGCWVSVARDAQTLALLNGMPLEAQEIPWGSEIDVGTITIRVRDLAGGLHPKSGILHSMLLGTVLFALVAGLMWYVKRSEISVPRSSTKPPALFVDDEVPECREPGLEAGRSAVELWHKAEFFLQRYPFDPFEGVRAVQSMAAARECATTSGEQGLDLAVARRLEEITDKVEGDYQILRLQLGRAIETKEHRLARGLTAKLLRLLTHRPGEYLKWLNRVDRFLTARIEEEEDSQ